MDETYYKVYIKTGDDNNIVEINSSAFLSDTKGFIEIDEGTGDKYHHAQNHYLDKPIMDEYGRYNYQYIDGEVVEIAETEKPSIPIPEPPLEIKNRADIDYIGMMTGVL